MLDPAWMNHGDVFIDFLKIGEPGFSQLCSLLEGLIIFGRFNTFQYQFCLLNIGFPPGDMQELDRLGMSPAIDEIYTHSYIYQLQVSYSPSYEMTTSLLATKLPSKGLYLLIVWAFEATTSHLENLCF